MGGDGFGDHRLASPMVPPAPIAPKRRNPAWMLGVLLVGYPVFWALGLAAFAGVVMSVPMAVELVRRRPLKLPRGFALWALFLLWTAVGVLMLGIDPSGYLPGSASGRLFGFGMREMSYISVTIIMLFIGNLTEEELPVRKIVSWLGWFFVTVVAGGVLGIVLPHLTFVSPFEMILPGGIRSNDFVQNLVHPRTAQVQELLSDATPRPAAPFTYTNAWGFHVTLLGFWFVVDRFLLKTPRSRLLSFGVLVVGVVVLMMSLNRAAWMGVVLAVMIVALRLALRGRLVMVVGIVMVAVFSVGALLATPMGDLVSSRLENGKSDDIRSFTTQKAFELSAKSPVTGFGTTRSSLGSASSIAVGRSPQCPTCGNASIGMNGYLYMLLVTTGYVGAGLFFGFAGYLVWRTRKIWNPAVLGASTVVLVTGFYSFFYDGATWMLVPFVSVAVLWREDQRRHTVSREGALDVERSGIGAEQHRGHPPPALPRGFAADGANQP